MKTYRVESATGPASGAWSIRVVIDGVIRYGTLGAGYESEAVANYSAAVLVADDKRRA
jgi:hypothetical protein